MYISILFMILVTFPSMSTYVNIQYISGCMCIFFCGFRFIQDMFQVVLVMGLLSIPDAAAGLCTFLSTNIFISNTSGQSQSTQAQCAITWIPAFCTHTDTYTHAHIAFSPLHLCFVFLPLSPLCLFLSSSQTPLRYMVVEQLQPLLCQAEQSTNGWGKMSSWWGLRKWLFN